MPCFLLAQESNGEGREQQYAALLNISPASAPARSFDNRYRGVQGTPYLHDDYREALIINVRGDSIRGLKARLNLVGPYVEVNALGGIHGKVMYDELQSLAIENLLGQTDYYKIQRVAEDYSLLEILYAGEIKFYRHLKKGFHKADYQGAYSAERPYDQFVDQYSFLVQAGNGELQKVKLKAKSFTKLFPKKKVVIQRFFKENTVEQGEDLVPLIKLLD